MKSPSTWFVLLTITCLVGPFAIGARPMTSRERLYVALTIAFLAWVLPMMAALR
jgi:hypothetical protein